MVGVKLFEPRLVEFCQRHSTLFEPVAEIRHQCIFEAIKKLFDLDVCESLDIVMVERWLADNGTLEDVGWQYLVSLFDLVATSHAMPHYIAELD